MKNQVLAVTALCLAILLGATKLSAQIGDYNGIDLNRDVVSDSRTRIMFHDFQEDDPFDIIRLRGGLWLGSLHTGNGVATSMMIGARAPALAFGVDQIGVGVGTTAAQETFHVYSDDIDNGYDQARILVENDKDDTALRTMFELVNNGPARFEMHNTNSDETWAFQTNSSDGFLINRLGSGGNEFSIRKSGMVTMGPGGQQNFILMPNGNLTILGTLNQQSDRNAKRDFQSVDTQAVLQKVASLPISTWRYKDETDQVRHMGPMAQDFRAAFGLGENETTIASVDTTGVAFAAIQALHKSAHEKDAIIARNQKQIKALNRINDENQARIGDLEQTVQQLVDQLASEKP